MTILVIVAGGKGTRLAGVIGGLPKVLASIGGKDNLSRLLELGQEYGYRRAIILAGEGFEQIESHLSETSGPQGIQADIVVEHEPGGTAGCFRELRGKIKERMLVLYGDISCDFDLARFEQFHEQHSQAVSVLVQPNSHVFDSDLVSLNEEGAIREIHRKPHQVGCFYENLTNAAAYCMEPSILDWLQEGACDWFHDVFPALIVKGNLPMAYRSWEYLQDFGTPERFEKAEMDYQNGIVGNRRADGHRTGALVVEVTTESLFCVTAIETIRKANNRRIPVMMTGYISQQHQEQLTDCSVYADELYQIKYDKVASMEKICHDNGINLAKTTICSLTEQGEIDVPTDALCWVQ